MRLRSYPLFFQYDIELGEGLKLLQSFLHFSFAQVFHSLRPEFFYTEGSQVRTVDNCIFHVFERYVFTLRNISCESTCKRISRSGRVKNFFQWQCRCKENFFTMEK